MRSEAQHRSIYLKRGAARFEVAPDASRPFVVVTREGQARAVGTDLTMTYAPLEGATVRVMEGKVQVTTMRSAATARGADPEYSSVTAGNTAVLFGGKVSSSVQIRRVYLAGDALRIEGATIGMQRLAVSPVHAN